MPVPVIRVAPPFFNPEVAQTAGMPHLLEHLRRKYHEALQEGLNATGQSAQFAVVALSAPADDFYAFAVHYLQNNRIMENFHTDMNLGIVLTDQSRLTVCPSTQIEGTMAGDDYAVGVTEGKSNPGLQGVNTSGSIRI